MNELATDKTMTIKEVAEVLSVSRSQIEKTVRELFPDRMRNGVTTHLTNVEATEIKKHIQTNPYLGQLSEVTTEVEMSEMTVKVISYHIEKSKRLEAEKAALLDEKRIMLPKAKVYDRIADASGTKSIQEVAAQMNIGSNTLFAVLRDKGILFREGSSNLPKREHIEAGRFIVVEEPYRVSGEDRVYSRTRVTPKGELWLAQIIEKGV